MRVRDVFGMLCQIVLCALALPPSGDWQLKWADEFDGLTLNTSWWNVGTLRGPATPAFPNGSLVPGAYGGHQLNWQYLGYIMEEDVLLQDGVLRLRNRKLDHILNGTDPVGNFSYTSGWIQSMHKVYYTYGYLEARLRYPLGRKVYPAFWTIEERLVWGAEFDIAEYYGTPFARACSHIPGMTVGGADIDVQTIPLEDCCDRCAGMQACAAAVYDKKNSTCHYKGSAKHERRTHNPQDYITLLPGPAGLGQHLHTGDYPATNWYDSWNRMCQDRTMAPKCAVADWHTYGLRWGPDGFDFYIDDELRHSMNASDVKSFPAKDMYLVLNNGVPYASEPTDTPWPNYADFDYVRLYKQGGSSVGSLVVGGSEQISATPHTGTSSSREILI